MEVLGCVVACPSKLLRSNFEQGVSNPSRSAFLQPFRRTSSILLMAMRECEGSGRCTVQYCTVLHCIMTMLCSPVVWVAALSGYASAPLEARGEEAEAVRVETSRCNLQVEPNLVLGPNNKLRRRHTVHARARLLWCCRDSSQGHAARIIVVAETRMQRTIW